MSKYLAIFKQSILYCLVHRGRVVIWILNDSLSFLIFPFIWLAVYGGREVIAGYTKADIVTYFIIIILIKLVCYSHISFTMRKDILEGRLNYYLVRPIHYIFSNFLHETSYKLFSATLTIPLVILISIFFNQYIIFPDSIWRILLFIISLILAFILSNALQFVVGFTCFWLGNNSGPQSLKHIIDMIFSGKIAPLVFFPSILQLIAFFCLFNIYLIFQPKFI